MAEVSTLIFRVAVPLRQGTTFEPFGSVGAGLARATRQPPPGESLPRTDTQAGFEVGGGATNVMRDFSLTRVTVGVDIRLSRSQRGGPQ